MIILGIVLLVLGYFFFRPLVWVGGLLVLIGVVLVIAHAGSGAYGYY